MAEGGPRACTCTSRVSRTRPSPCRPPCGGGGLTRRRAPEAGHPPFPTAALAFVRYYVLRRRLAFGAVFALVVAAALCAVAVQYGMRLLVDAMAAGAGRPARRLGRRSPPSWA